MTSSFLLYGPLALLGLLVLVALAVVLLKYDWFDSIKEFVAKLFGGALFYAVSLGLAWMTGGLLEFTAPWVWELPAGIDDRMMRTPFLYILLGLGSLHIVMPDRWATSRMGGYMAWGIAIAMVILVGGYAMGVFPPPSFWEADSFRSLDPAIQAAFRWVWPPFYPLDGH